MKFSLSAVSVEFWSLSYSRSYCSKGICRVSNPGTGAFRLGISLFSCIWTNSHGNLFISGKNVISIAKFPDFLPISYCLPGPTLPLPGPATFANRIFLIKSQFSVQIYKLLGLKNLPLERVRTETIRTEWVLTVCANKQQRVNDNSSRYHHATKNYEPSLSLRAED